MSKKIFDMGKNANASEPLQMVSGWFSLGGGILHGDVPEKCPTCGQPNFRENYRRKYDEERVRMGFIAK